MSESMIPDGLSFAQLQEMLESASSEPESTNNKPQLTERQMQRLIDDAIKSVNEQFDGNVFSYKLLALASLHMLYRFHNDTHAQACEDGEFDAALAWGRDAGWLQMCMNALSNINCGPLDFVCED